MEAYKWITFTKYVAVFCNAGEALNNTNETATTPASTVISISLNSTASTVANVTSTDNADRHFKLFKDNSGLLQRSLYVVSGTEGLENSVNLVSSEPA